MVCRMSGHELGPVAPRVGTRVRTLACALALALVAVLADSASGGSPERPKDGWIVYPTTVRAEAGAQIISASVRGGKQRLVIGGRHVSRGLALSPDGKWIAFVRKWRGGPAIWVIRSNGRGQRRLSSGSRPAWSPDSSRLVFLGPRGRSGLRTIRLDGFGLRALVGAQEPYRARPVWSPAGNWIAYVVGKDELRIVRPDGRRSRRVGRINSTSARSVFCWSSDGRRLAYFGSTGYLYTVSLTRGRPKRLKAVGLDPQWSPDGTRIAFTDHSTTMVIRVRGTAAPRLVSGGDAPSWSPDSSKLAVASGNQVWVARANGRGAWRVSRGAAFSDDSGVFDRPAWAPDGRRILFSRANVDPGQLMIVSPTGDQRRRLTPVNRLAESEPTFSPDGRMVAFTGMLDDQRTASSGIYVVRAEGTGLRRLPLGRWPVSQPTWSPDGNWIAFMRWIRNEHALYAVPVAGGKATRIATLKSGNPAWGPGRWIATDGIDLMSPTGQPGGRITRPPEYGYDHQPDWSPDGKRFAFTRVPGGCRQCETGYLSIGELGSSSVRQTTAAVTSPHWSPDGSRIAALTYGGGVLVTMLPDGSDLRVVGVDLGEQDGGVEIDWGPAR